MLVSLNFKETVWPRECSWGLWPFCYFCCHALSDVCKWRTWPPSPVSPWHEKFRLTLLFKPFLMKSTQKWNWLMPNEYHWTAVIVRLMFVTLKLFIKHQFHFKSGRAMKCALTPLRLLWGFLSTISLKLNNRRQRLQSSNLSFASLNANLTLLRQKENKQQLPSHSCVLFEQ